MGNDILTGPVPESALELDNVQAVPDWYVPPGTTTPPPTTVCGLENYPSGGKRHFGWSNCAKYSNGRFSSHDALHQCRSAGYNAWCGRNQDCGRACWGCQFHRFY